MNTMSQYRLPFLGNEAGDIDAPYLTKCTKTVKLIMPIKMCSITASITFRYSATWQGNRTADYYVGCVAGAVARNVAPLK